MTLNSQTPRAALSRQYMSRKRRSPRWPWALLGFLGVVIAGVYYLASSGGSSDEAANAAPVAAADPADLTASLPAADPRVVQFRSTAPATTPATTSAEQPPPLPPRQDRATLANAPAAPAGSSATASSSTDPVAQPVRLPPPAGDPRPVNQRTARPAYGVAVAPASIPELDRGMALVAEGRLVEGRRVLSALLFGDRTLPSVDAATVRDTLTSINQRLVFSNEVMPGDTVAEYHTIQSGDMLARLAPPYRVPYRFVTRINDVNPSRLHVGQRIKFIKGPFHAVVTKDDYRMDVYVHGDDGGPVYICSFPVGLGEYDSTPLGSFVVEKGRKVVNPGWADPRTGKYYEPDDPMNPIGEFWIALRGTSPQTENLKGYGIHGTIEPESIGSQASMGCIRLRDQDVALVYDMLAETHSTVEIVR
ncbi:MAG: L,D-transpeptidase family protein [Planctomycetota bacterium]